MATRLAVLSDVHGNVAALEAALGEIGRAKPDLIAVAGDLALNGPDPQAVLERVRRLEQDGATVVQGNTDIAVADFDYAAAFPWMPEVPESFRAAAEWANEQLDADALEWLRRLPAERRLMLAETMVLVCHASPGSQTAGFLTDLDAAVVVEMVGRTDARVICCGHTHVPEVRDLGWKVIANDGSCGYAFDGDPSASWALIEVEGDEVRATIQRTAYDAGAAADAISRRGLPGDVYRAATVRSGRLIR
ncbi:MAG TPA: metallophosphoesterase family protein [Candidatus Limnocylindrales bacterium]|nr:metallophosphoesterase family protein [Candidatus Limnocylindrales bacterium]